MGRLIIKWICLIGLGKEKKKIGVMPEGVLVLDLKQDWYTNAELNIIPRFDCDLSEVLTGWGYEYFFFGGGFRIVIVLLFFMGTGGGRLE